MLLVLRSGFVLIPVRRNVSIRRLVWHPMLDWEIRLMLVWVNHRLMPRATSQILESNVQVVIGSSHWEHMDMEWRLRLHHVLRLVWLRLAWLARVQLVRLSLIREIPLLILS